MLIRLRVGKKLKSNEKEKNYCLGGEYSLLNVRGKLNGTLKLITSISDLFLKKPKTLCFIC